MNFHSNENDESGSARDRVIRNERPGERRRRSFDDGQGANSADDVIRDLRQPPLNARQGVTTVIGPDRRQHDRYQQGQLQQAQQLLQQQLLQQPMASSLPVDRMASGEGGTVFNASDASWMARRDIAGSSSDVPTIPTIDAFSSRLGFNSFGLPSVSMYQETGVSARGKGSNAPTGLGAATAKQRDTTAVSFPCHGSSSFAIDTHLNHHIAAVQAARAAPAASRAQANQVAQMNNVSDILGGASPTASSSVPQVHPPALAAPSPHDTATNIANTLQARYVSGTAHTHSIATATALGCDWSVCRFCKAQAYVTSDELINHETSCRLLHSPSQTDHTNTMNNTSTSVEAFTPADPTFAAAAAASATLYASNNFRGSSEEDTDTPTFGDNNGVEHAFQQCKSSHLDHLQPVSFDVEGNMPLGAAPSFREEATYKQQDNEAINQEQHRADRTSTSDSSNDADESSVDEDGYSRLSSPRPLSMPSDRQWLTPLHCFVRLNFVEIFTATETDVETPSKGKRRTIQVGQVGIRCPHCAPRVLRDGSTMSLKPTDKGSLYYPTAIASIYNATMNILQRHIYDCPLVPSDIIQRYQELKSDDARSGKSKQYWTRSAKAFGLVDTDEGIRYCKPSRRDSLSRIMSGVASERQRATAVNIAPSPSGNISPAPTPQGEAETQMQCIVYPEDESESTAFTYYLLSQIQQCSFTEADRLGKRKGLPIGFAGLACRHCYGQYGMGRFFPSSVKTLSDTSKTLNVLFTHLMRCRNCPVEVSERLVLLQKAHKLERERLKFGSQKDLMEKIWARLHGGSTPPTRPSSKRQRSRTSSPSASSWDPVGAVLPLSDTDESRSKRSRAA